ADVAARSGAARRPSGDGASAGHCHIVPFIHDMPAAYAAADLVVCRAGAITLAEIAARGLPAVLVPYPFAAERHQDANAAELDRKSTRLNSSHVKISYAVFCLKKKKK